MQGTAAWIGSEETQSEYTVVPSLTHYLSPAAVQFWNDRPGDGIVIGRDVPSRAIGRLLSSIIIYQPVDGGRDLRVHLAGTSLRRRFGRDITGLKMSELFGPGQFPIRFKTAMDVVATGEAKMSRIIHRVGSMEVLRIELLTMPALSPDRTEQWPLAFVFYF